MLAEDFGRPLRFGKLREEVPESEDMTQLVDHGIELLLRVFLEHLGVEKKVVPARIGKEGAGQHASGCVAVVALADRHLEVPGVVVLLELHWQRRAPVHERFADQLADLLPGSVRVLEVAQRPRLEPPAQRRVLVPERDEAARGIDDDVEHRAAVWRGMPDRIGDAPHALMVHMVGRRIRFRLPARARGERCVLRGGLHVLLPPGRSIDDAGQDQSMRRDAMLSCFRLRMMSGEQATVF